MFCSDRVFLELLSVSPCVFCRFYFCFLFPFFGLFVIVFFRQTRKTQTKCNLQKHKCNTIVRIFVGQAGAGKTTMIKRLTSDNSDDSDENVKRTTECKIYPDLNRCNVFYMDTPGTGNVDIPKPKLVANLLLLLAKEQIKRVKIVWYDNNHETELCLILVFSLFIVFLLFVTD